MGCLCHGVLLESGWLWLPSLALVRECSPAFAAPRRAIDDRGRAVCDLRQVVDHAAGSIVAWGFGSHGEPSATSCELSGVNPRAWRSTRAWCVAVLCDGGSFRDRGICG